MTMDVASLVSDNLEIWTTAVERKSGGGRGGSKRVSLYGLDRLRTLILDLAVRGKLVPQDLNEEPASELLKRISAERARLTKADSIGKRKTAGRKSDVAPYPIPNNWAWTQIADIGHDWGQKEPSGDFTYVDVGSIDQRAGVIRSPSVLSPSEAPSRARKVVRAGTVIYSTVRPYLLNIAIVDQDFDPEPIASTAFAVVHPFEGVSASFLYRYLRSATFVSYVEDCQTGIAYPAINDKQFFSAWFPLPPFAEQQRIVAKVDELMALCDTLESESAAAMVAHQALVATLLRTLTDSADAAHFAANWSRLEAHFDTLFNTEASIDALKETIFDLAVRGKLVRQDENEEPAAGSLAKIATKRAELVALGVAKRVQPKLSQPAPFDLPQGWTSCTLGMISSLITKGSSPTWQGVNYVSADEGMLFITSENVGNFHLRKLDELKYVEARFRDVEPRSMLKTGDILINLVGASIGRTALYDLELEANINQAVALVRLVDPEITPLPQFLLLYLNSNTAISAMLGSRVITAQPNISLTDVSDFFVPLPPMAEQRRIVAKVEELIAVCEALRSRIAEAGMTQKLLADAVVEKAAA